MIEAWQKNIAESLQVVQRNAGPALVTIVSGSEIDQEYWQKHLRDVSHDVFRADGETVVSSVAETTRKGNFLGTLNAWAETKATLRSSNRNLPPISLMSMVFGKGKRLSPFTQALGNRKPTFPTPRRAEAAGTHLDIADLSNLYANVLIQFLYETGFRGCAIKWGDEAIIPGGVWNPRKNNYGDVDAVRFIFKTEITEDLAREKEWVVADPHSGLMTCQFARQSMDALRQRVAALDEGTYELGVNLGSLAISYDFLDVALMILGEDVADPQKWADWDPYVWMALCCRDERDWQAEIRHEDQIGKTGIRELESHYPDFYPKIKEVRNVLEAKTGRPLAVAALDFGEALWVDFGLHLALRSNLEALITDSDRGVILRDLFAIPHTRDNRGNIIVRSNIPTSADIHNSVLIDTVILDSRSVIHGALVVGGRHRLLQMPEGGSALFCAADHLAFDGAHGIAFRSVDEKIFIPSGGRHTTLFLPDRAMGMRGSESVVDYSGANYSQPILDNLLSFEEAGKLMARVSRQDIESRWLGVWQQWLS